jgi:hypothetical protein
MIYNLYVLLNIIRIMKSSRLRRAWHVRRMEQKRNAQRILVGKSEAKRPLGKIERRWEGLREKIKVS